VDRRGARNLTALQVAAKHNLQRAEVLLKAGADVFVRNSKGLMPLHESL
jgi:ankyrin repeat protein